MTKAPEVTIVCAEAVETDVVMDVDVLAPVIIQVDPLEEQLAEDVLLL